MTKDKGNSNKRKGIVKNFNTKETLLSFQLCHLKIWFITLVNNGRITTVKDLENWHFEH